MRHPILISEISYAKLAMQEASCPLFHWKETCLLGFALSGLLPLG